VIWSAIVSGEYVEKVGDVCLDVSDKNSGLVRS
jgi:hypothetical protein